MYGISKVFESVTKSAHVFFELFFTTLLAQCTLPNLWEKHGKSCTVYLVPELDVLRDAFYTTTES